MDADTQSMKTMRLYDQVERINNELLALGIAEDAALNVEQLTPFDQYHYHGTNAVDDAVRVAQIGAGSKVLEIGSGIGGPARWLAHSAKCRVTALELQPDLNALAEHLTARCGLPGQVSHVCGNFLEAPLSGQQFDAIVSFLCFLHIPAREKLFQLSYEALTPGGRIVIEDYTKLREPDARQRDLLKTKVQCPWLPDAQTYHRQLQDAGLIVEEFTDMSVDWTAFTAERLAAFRGARERNEDIHGKEVTAGLDDFYDTVATMFAEGVIGGARIVARKASNP